MCTRLSYSFKERKLSSEVESVVIPVVYTVLVEPVSMNREDKCENRLMTKSDRKIAVTYFFF